MITIFFNEDGYYIAGEGVNITKRCSPALTANGDPIFQSIHHSYKILYLALMEVYNTESKGDIMVYNDSRIIDEMNGLVLPLDITCTAWVNLLKRDRIPRMKPVIFFRKNPPSRVAQVIKEGHDEMLQRLDAKERDKIAESSDKIFEAEVKKRNLTVLDRLKQSWFGKSND